MQQLNSSNFLIFLDISLKLGNLLSFFLQIPNLLLFYLYVRPFCQYEQKCWKSTLGMLLKWDIH